MINNKVILVFLLFSFLLLSCGIEPPYLIVYVENKYNSSNISIPYSYKSESSYQTCRITVEKEGISGPLIIQTQEERLPDTGTLSYSLDKGQYNLRFSVLSDRGQRREILAFLDETYSFLVSDEE